MHRVRIRLCPGVPFWFFGGVNLNEADDTSNWLNLDLAPPAFVEGLKASMAHRIIKIYDKFDEQILSLDRFLAQGDKDSSTPVVESPVLGLPEIKSITEESEPEVEESSESEMDVKEAKLILSGNGNAIAKIVRDGQFTKKFLELCLKYERENACRARVLKSIEDAINAKSREF